MVLIEVVMLRPYRVKVFACIGEFFLFVFQPTMG